LWLTCRVPHPDAPGLGDLVAEPGPFLAGDLFHRAVWSPQADGGRDPARFATVEVLWADFLERHYRTPFFRLVRDGTTLPSDTYCRAAGVGHRTLADVVQPNRVVELYQSGATLVLQGLQLSDPHLGRVANNLALALDHPVQVNAYLTPAGTKGLELHFDFHDVFVLQLDGHKRWRVWEPLARTEMPVRDGLRPAMPTFDELGPPLMDFTLSAGDGLYLPRGFPHAAEAVDASSAHLTVGVMARTWQQVVRHALDAALGERALRESLPVGTLDGRVLTAAPDLKAVAAHLDPATVRAWLAAETWRRQPSTRLRPLVAPPIDITRPVTVTPGPLLWLTDATEAGPPRVVIGMGDRRLTLPGEARAFLAALFESPSGFAAGAWGGPLDRDSRQVVLDRLAAEGVVTQAES